MNINKAQKDIFNHLLNGDSVRKFDVDENNLFVTPTGYYGFVIPITSLQVNPDKIPEMKQKLDIKSVVCEENLCKLTDECKLLFHPRKTYAIKLTHGSGNVFVNESYLQYFQNPKFYYNEKSMLLVVTEKMRTGQENIVGVICPIRVQEKEV